MKKEVVGNIYLALVIITSLLTGGLLSGILPFSPTIYFVVPVWLYLIFTKVKDKRTLKKNDPERYERERRETLGEYFERRKIEIESDKNKSKKE